MPKILFSITLFAMPILYASAQEIIFFDGFESGDLNKQYWPVQRSDKGSSTLGNLVSGILEGSTARNTYEANSETFTIMVDGLEPFDVAGPLSEAEGLDKILPRFSFKMPHSILAAVVI